MFSIHLVDFAQKTCDFVNFRKKALHLKNWGYIVLHMSVGRSVVKLV